MSRVLVGRGRSTRSATGGEGSGFLPCVLMGEESRVLFRSALRSTASPQTALRRTRDPSPPRRGGSSRRSQLSATNVFRSAPFDPPNVLPPPQRQAAPEPPTTAHIVPWAYSLAHPRLFSYLLNGGSTELEKSSCRDEANPGWSYGIAEPSTGLTMGEHTEIMVKEWQISQGEQDEIAFRSHINAHRATEDGRLLAEIHPLNSIDRDLLIRPNTSREALAKLSPVFDRRDTGTITAGNSSPLTDGAASVVLMAEDRARDLGYEPLAYVKDFINVGIDPKDGLLMGPGIAIPRLLKQNNLTLGDIDIIEMHEAFGGQVASNIKAWEQGWKESAIGLVDRDKLNPLGSSIAIGHPFAATGARIVTTLANELKRRDARYGLVSICGAGATAVAMLLERA